MSELLDLDGWIQPSQGVSKPGWVARASLAARCPRQSIIYGADQLEIWDGSSHGRHGTGPRHALPDRWLLLDDLTVQYGVVDWWW